jgi:CRP-like cAMP-binding protein
MPSTADELRHVPLFSLLDDDELTVLAQQVEVHEFAARQRIYKAGDPGTSAFVVLDGVERVPLIDEYG